MANGARTLGIVIALVLGLAIGWFLGKGAAPPPPVPVPTPQPTVVATPPPGGPGVGDHIIRVGPEAKDVSIPEAEISISQGNVVVWYPTDPKKKLKIHFKHQDYPPEANGEPPFENGSKGADQIITCDPGKPCPSGPINHNLKPDPNNPNYKLKYKYWQSLDDGPPADADIIIEK